MKLCIPFFLYCLLFFFIFSQPAKLDNLLNVIKFCLICTDYLRFFFLLLFVFHRILTWKFFKIKKLVWGNDFFLCLCFTVHIAVELLWVGWFYLLKNVIKNINLLVESIATIVNLLVLLSSLNWLFLLKSFFS